MRSTATSGSLPREGPLPFRFVLLAVLVSLLVPTTAAAQWDSTTALLLARGDTSAALSELRHQARATDSPECWCALAQLLTSMATMRQVSWRIRQEASEAFARGLRRETAECLYGYALLKEKQGARIDAQRMLKRAERLVAVDSAAATPAFRAAVLYRKALLLDDWLRNFDFLVQTPLTLGVSTPDCIEKGYFCEDFARPRLFNERLLHAPSLASVIADQRRVVVQWLDSVLRLDPTHGEAQRLRLRRALVEDRWDEFEEVAGRWVRAEPAAVAARLALVAAQVQRKAYREAGQTLAVIDSLIPDSLKAGFERLEVITRGADFGRAEALWALSDPLYLTPLNERRVQLYARIALADIMFTDPTERITGRDTQPGKLFLRYGWPAHIWEVFRDQSLELDPAAMRLVVDFVAGRIPEDELRKTGAKAGGRWTFFNYDLDVPSFVFERQLSERALEYKRETLTEQLDSMMARVLPSSYDNPYRAGMVSAVLTRFPRPGKPALEVHARFGWEPDTLGASDRVDLGVFVHERVGGRLVNRGTTSRGGQGEVTFEAVLPVIAGPLQVEVEGMTARTGAAGQLRAALDVTLPEGLALSDLLLADLVDSVGEVNQRADVRLVGRADTLPAPLTDLTVYWETYGLTVGTDSTARYTVTVKLAEAAGGRTPGAEVVRVLGRALGLRGEAGSFTWQRQRPLGAGGYAADVVTLRLPEGTGSYRLLVTVQDDVAGTSATSERGLTLVRRSE
jgi:hypothetical protein